MSNDLNPSQSSQHQTDQTTLVANHLPQPITVTGSAVEPPTEAPQQISSQTTVQNTSEDTSLPMPAVFGDEEGDDMATLRPSSVTTHAHSLVVEETPTEEAIPQEKIDLPELSVEPTAVDNALTADDNLLPIGHQSETSVMKSEDSNSSPTQFPEVTEQDTQDDHEATNSSMSFSSIEPSTLNLEPEPKLAPSQDIEIPNLSLSARDTADEANVTFSETTEPSVVSEEDEKISFSPLPINQVETSIQETAEVIPAVTTPVAADGDILASVATSVDEMQTPNLQPSPSVKKPSIFPKIALGLVAVFIGSSLVVGGYVFFFNGNDPKQIPTQAVVETQTPPATPMATPTATLAPTPKPEVKVDMSKLKAKVLNGSGEKGAAKTGKTLLEDGGLQGVAVGNADNFDYVKTEVRLKAEYEELYDQIKQMLDNDYTVVAGDEVEEGDAFDVYVVLGASKSGSKTTKAEEKSPTPKASPKPTPKSEKEATSSSKSTT